MAICPNCQQRSTDVLDPCPSGDGFFCVDEDEYYSHRDDTFLGRNIGGRYIVQSVLGRGSMSRVYKAHQDQVDRAVALKIFRPETILGRRRGTHTTEEQRRRAEDRFVQEAQVLGKLSHPNCVTVYDFGVEEDRSFLFIAMEFVAGNSLRTAIRRGVKAQAVAAIIGQVLQALREAHSLNVVHRDLKPENIILSFRYSSDEQVVKVLDFGIAKLLRADTNQGRPGELFGTPAYMSPEQCRGDGKQVGPEADIYALGCVFYEMVVGELPFPAESPEEMVRLHREAPIPEIRPRPSMEVPEGFKSYIRRCLQKEPDERFGSAHEAYAAFREMVAASGLAPGREFPVGDSGEQSRAARRVVVPENRVTGAQLDPIPESEQTAHESDSASGPATMEFNPEAGSVTDDPGEADPPEPSVLETAPGRPGFGLLDEESGDEESGGEETGEQGRRPEESESSAPAGPSTRQTHVLDTMSDNDVGATTQRAEADISQTLSGSVLDTKSGETAGLNIGERLLGAVDSNTLAVLMAVLVVAGFCLVVFYFIYLSMMGA